MNAENILFQKDRTFYVNLIIYKYDIELTLTYDTYFLPGMYIPYDIHFQENRINNNC